MSIQFAVGLVKSQAGIQGMSGHSLAVPRYMIWLQYKDGICINSVNIICIDNVVLGQFVLFYSVADSSGLWWSDESSVCEHQNQCLLSAQGGISTYSIGLRHWFISPSYPACYTLNRTPFEAQTGYFCNLAGRHGLQCRNIFLTVVIGHRR